MYVDVGLCLFQTLSIGQVLSEGRSCFLFSPSPARLSLLAANVYFLYALGCCFGFSFLYILLLLPIKIIIIIN